MQTMLENHQGLDPKVKKYMFDRCNNYEKRGDIDAATKPEVIARAKEYRELCRTQYISMCSARHSKKHGGAAVTKSKVSGENQFDAWIRYAAGSSPEVIAQWLRMIEALEEGNIVDSFKAQKDGTIQTIKMVRSVSVFLNVLHLAVRVSQSILKHVFRILRTTIA